MIKIQQFRYSADNLGYLVYGEREAMAVDGGATGPILSFVEHKKYSPSHVFSTIGDERKVNPFLRFNEPSIVELLKDKGLRVGTERERWFSVMAL